MSQRNGSARRTTTSRSRSLRPPVLCALLVGALATVTACGSDTGGGDSAQRASSASSAAPPSAPSAASSDSSDSSGGGSSRNERPSSQTASPQPSAHRAPSGGSSARPEAASGVRRICSKAQLTLSAGRLDMGAGNVYLPLVFTNKGSTTCTLTGYPGVSLRDSAGAGIGAPATRRGPTRSTVSLPPGGRASAALHTLNEGTTDTPCRRTAERIRVYPPDSFDAMNVSVRSFRVCGGVFEVEAMRSGTGG
ncbi:DUF4232 domain-containing protein [Streptomyces malaysiensis]|uniref:DUF4232 domain-containing protein n=2 Tax=Streptomyces TaxID=1883 RepID=UPI00142EABBC|nr:DUF4232 domain-containing protein [Streptomyces malaysiensis]